ncbi:potassium transporter Kup [Paenirhodobacter enshiensis]|uniref:potassium transporter Kup n=1 Tax=Paenirhodobacter enshiensis TaxID=1105367 RepID=UPI0009DFAFF2|nr:potassium transporter Kup [Paenirhodobacter enshiensis]
MSDAHTVPDGDVTHDPDAGPAAVHRSRTLALTLGAVGVVYGDIGTSPLYALREAVAAAGASSGRVPAETVLGVLSLILWTLVVIVSVKYVTILLRADNDGEGGTLSLLALAQRAVGRPSAAVLILGILGAALFYGDALITPAISVLSAIEGLVLVMPGSERFVVPAAIGIIAGLFAIQRQGTDAVARFFGPVMLVWFAVLALAGVWRILDAPAVLAALNPWYAAAFMVGHPAVALVVLGAVFLAVTGAEALYADMGHFGRRPIRLGWFAVAFPALVLNYMGQGALLLVHPETLSNPFYLMFPDWALSPLVILATLATIIASQAVITGTFSLTQQAVQLQLLPRMNIRHTSEAHPGQIYLPSVNALLLIGVLSLVIMFGSSSALAAAYGISVTGTMVITAVLTMVVAHRHWGWSVPASVALMIPFLLIDLVFLGANLVKIADGGFVPIGIAAAMLVVMWSWRRGTGLMLARDSESALPLATLLGQINEKSVASVPGTAVFLTADPAMAPVALLHSLKHFKALHEQNMILTVRTANVPHVPEAARVSIAEIAPRFRQILLSYGYAEDPDVPQALMLCRRKGLKFDIMATSFILSRRRLRLSSRSLMPRWQARVFIYLSRNSASASDYFRIPAGRVVELGTQMNV